MPYNSITAISALATSRMIGDYKPFYSFDMTKALYGNDNFPASAQDCLNSASTGNQWKSQFMPVQAQWPLKLNVDLGAAYNITRIYYENSHDGGSYTQVGFKDVEIYGSNSISAFNEVRGDIKDGLTLLWGGTFDRHITTVEGYLDNGVYVPRFNGDAADPKYITLTNTNSFRYYSFVVYSTYDVSTTSAMGYIGVRRLELQIYNSSSSSSSSSSSHS